MHWREFNGMDLFLTGCIAVIFVYLISLTFYAVLFYIAYNFILPIWFNDLPEISIFVYAFVGFLMSLFFTKINVKQ